MVARDGGAHRDRGVVDRAVVQLPADGGHAPEEEYIAEHHDRDVEAPEENCGSPDADPPIGDWQTEGKGTVRIGKCGNALCGYVLTSSSNDKGEAVLINMKPAKDKWTGRIYDPNSGSTYDSTIALKSSDSLRVQGCAFGGMFCGGQTWSRLN